MIQHIIENKIVYLLRNLCAAFLFWRDGSIYRWIATTIFCLFFSIRKDRDVTKNTPFFCLPPPLQTFTTHRPNFKRVCYLNLKGVQFLPQKLNDYHCDVSSYSFPSTTHCFYVFAPNKYSSACVIWNL